jgi:hypothetical protein
MAVVATLGVNVAARAAAAPPKAVEPQHFYGRVRILTDRAVIAAGAEVGSTVELGELPWDCVIGARSIFLFDAMGASVMMTVGLRADAENGFAEDDDLLVTATSVASAGSFSGLAAIGIEKTGKKLWELAGLTACPPGNQRAKLFATLKGATTTPGGDVAWEYQFVVD